MILNGDHIVVADLSEKKWEGVNQLLHENGIEAKVGGWLGTSESNKMSSWVKRDKKELFDSINGSKVKLFVVSHLYRSIRTISAVLESSDRQKIESIFVASSNATIQYKYDIDKLCQQYNIPVFYYWLNYDQVYNLFDPVEVPWVSSTLDSDLDEALRKLNIKKGNCLDVGTGIGSQAIELSKKGFDVTASDISKEGIRAARKHTNGTIKFVVDNILKSRMKDQFDFVWDRGCFHCMNIDDVPSYVENIRSLLKPKGYLFLKTLRSFDSETSPYAITESFIREHFSDSLKVLAIEACEYEGAYNLKVPGLFATIQLD